MRRSADHCPRVRPAGTSQDRTMNYIGNALSLGMLDFLDPAGDCTAVLDIVALTEDEAATWAAENEWLSCVGHDDTARLFTKLLRITIDMHRRSTSLRRGDYLLVGQYIGPRLPEGVTSLPPEARIRWMLVSVG
jgi:hypothetical protein